MKNNFIFPKPKDWEAFEDIINDVFSRKYHTDNLQRYGRRGQKQKGVDIAGLIDRGVIGIQCKHHATKGITTGEVDAEVKKSEHFKPELSEYVIATSAPRDAVVHAHALSLSKARKEKSRYPITVKFWEDVCEWLFEHPDLVFKHFTAYLPLEEIKDIAMKTEGSVIRKTVSWPVGENDLQKCVQSTLGGVEKVEPYHLVVGISTFSDVSFKNIVDVEFPFADLFSGRGSPEEYFKQAASALNSFKLIASKQFFSKDMTVYLQCRLSSAFLAGWVFRRVTHHRLKLIFNGQVWATEGLPLVPSGLLDDFPVLLNDKSNEAVLILSVSRDIKNSVADFVEGWDQKPKAILTYSVEGYKVKSGAQALSLAIDISNRIKNLIDRWGIRRIHLFGALPAALAALIAYNLNAICPINIYFLDDARGSYKVGGELVNNL